MIELTIKQGFIQDELGETEYTHKCSHYMDRYDTPICKNCGEKMQENDSRDKRFLHNLRFHWWCSNNECKEKSNKLFDSQVKKQIKNIDLDKSLACCGVSKSMIGVSREGLIITNTKGYGIDPKILDQMTGWLNGHECNLYLWGGVGSGKTHVAIALLRELILIGRISIYFKNVPDLLFDIRNSFREGANETDSDIIYRYSNYAILVLDDLGAEKESEYSITALYMILNHRQESKRITIITGNMNLEEISDKTGERIASRINAFGKGIWHLKGKDWRRK